MPKRYHGYKLFLNDNNVFDVDPTFHLAMTLDKKNLNIEQKSVSLLACFYEWWRLSVYFKIFGIRDLASWKGKIRNKF